MFCARVLCTVGSSFFLSGVECRRRERGGGFLLAQPCISCCLPYVCEQPRSAFKLFMHPPQAKGRVEKKGRGILKKQRLPSSSFSSFTSYFFVAPFNSETKKRAKLFWCPSGGNETHQALSLMNLHSVPFQLKNFHVEKKRSWRWLKSETRGVVPWSAPNPIGAHTLYACTPLKTGRVNSVRYLSSGWPRFQFHAFLYSTVNQMMPVDQQHGQRIAASFKIALDEFKGFTQLSTSFLLWYLWLNLISIPCPQRHLYQFSYQLLWRHYGKLPSVSFRSCDIHLYPRCRRYNSSPPASYHWSGRSEIRNNEFVSFPGVVFFSVSPQLVMKK